MAIIKDLKDYVGESGGKHGLDSISKGIVGLVEKYGNFYPYCKQHGALLKVSTDGIWRCNTGYSTENHGCYYDNR